VSLDRVGLWLTDEESGEESGSASSSRSGSAGSDAETKSDLSSGAEEQEAEEADEGVAPLKEDDEPQEVGHVLEGDKEDEEAVGEAVVEGVMCDDSEKVTDEVLWKVGTVEDVHDTWDDIIEDVVDSVAGRDDGDKVETDDDDDDEAEVEEEGEVTGGVSSTIVTVLGDSLLWGVRSGSTRTGEHHRKPPRTFDVLKTGSWSL